MLASDYSKFGEEALRMQRAGVGFSAMDVMDGCFVPNISFGAGVIKAVHKVCDAPLDVHLMVNDPIRYAQDFVEAGASIPDGTRGVHAASSACRQVHSVSRRQGRCGAQSRNAAGRTQVGDG